MGISELRQLGPPTGASDLPVSQPGRDLLRAGVVSARDLALAQTVRRQCDTSLDRILMTEGLADEAGLLSAHARRLATRCLGAGDVARAQVAETGLAPGTLLRHGILPLDQGLGEPVVITGAPERFQALRPDLPAPLDRARLLLAPHRAVQDRLAAHYSAQLTAAARARVPAIESCRNWGRHRRTRLTLTLAVLAGVAALALAFPVPVFAVVTVWAALTLLVAALLKTAAGVAGVTAEAPAPAKAEAAAPPLPKVSILVPLFRETEIAHALIARLSRLTYPKSLLDVVLVLEEDDALTRATLAAIDLPGWMRPVIVPRGSPRTKPRAMNYALDFCEGDIIGIFDAEDAPDPDQITKVARRFQQAPPEVACLQGILDYYNPRQNWLARCFTIEYATWFRLMLPGMAQLGLAIPLGGTTLYFRRDALERLGGWDAHNVTEDADLGFRLARHGYRTEMIGTVTEEEANCRPWPWIKQRSRWLKGYMTTYLVNMRRPRLLYRQLGAWKFWGFQAHFMSALSQVLLAPVLWSFWLLIAGLPHPLDQVLPTSALVACASLFLVVELLNVSLHMLAVSGPRHRHLMVWAPTMHLYAPLAAIAAYKALYELVANPFFWDKTAHGLSPQGRRAPQPRSDGARDLA